MCSEEFPANPIPKRNNRDHVIGGYVRGGCNRPVHNTGNGVSGRSFAHLLIIQYLTEIISNEQKRYSRYRDHRTNDLTYAYFLSEQKY